MTNEQREQARRAQAAYAEFLHWCVEYAWRDKGLPPSTTADLEQGFAALHGLSGEKDFSIYQDFRAFLPDGKRAEFDKLRDDVCKAYHEQGIDAAVQRLEDEARYVEGFDFGTDKEITPDLLKDLTPESNRTDAIQYCARLVCHVWDTGEHGGKRKSADHVFVKAKEGESLFGDCKYARTLVAKWGISVGGIMTVAAKIHAGQSGGKHTKADGMERPETMRQAAKKSRAKEQAEERAERKR